MLKVNAALSRACKGQTGMEYVEPNIGGAPRALICRIKTPVSCCLLVILDIHRPHTSLVSFLITAPGGMVTADGKPRLEL